ncbi:MAG: hypothetical protein JNM00_10345 [Flavobacteriales bacterium]|nr:hypothetical protein [Flavobacteriales bacterium]
MRTLLVSLVVILAHNAKGQSHNWKVIKDYVSLNTCQLLSIPGGQLQLLSYDRVCRYNQETGYWEIEYIDLAGVNGDVEILDNAAYFVSPNGKIYKSQDSGEIWDAMPTPLNENDNICVLSEDTMFVSSDAKLYQSVDGGNTWSLIWNLINEDILALDIRSSGHGLCSRENAWSGRMSKTTNGGLSWVEIDPVHDYFYEVYMVSDSIAVGQKYVGNGIWRSENFGTSWTEVLPYVDEFVQVSPMEYYAMVDQQVIFTSDGFLNWEERTPIPVDFGACSSELFFETALHGSGYVCNSQIKVIYETLDGGISWNEISGLPNDDLGSIQVIDFINDSTGFIGSESIHATNDGGRSWHWKTPCFFPQDTYLITVSPDTVYKYNSNMLWVSVNGGVTLSIVHDFDIDYWVGRLFRFGNNWAGFTAGFSDGHLLSSSDGGMTYVEEVFDSDDDMLCGYALPNGSIWVLTNSSYELKMWRSDDMGQTWWSTVAEMDPVLYQETNHSSPIEIQMLNESEGWMTWYWPPSLLHTNDGGLSWELRNTPGSNIIRDMYFSDSMHGSAISDGETNLQIYTTNDGGFTWSDSGLPENNYQLIEGTDSQVFSGASSGVLARASLLPVPGDFNDDGELTTSDLLTFIACWGCIGDCGSCDMNEDGIVNLLDLFIFLSLF